MSDIKSGKAIAAVVWEGMLVVVLDDGTAWRLVVASSPRENLWEQLAPHVVGGGWR